jgi:hypothetical protein
VDANKEFFLAWDRPWDIKAWTILKSPPGAPKYLQNLTLYAFVTYKSGLRYTPTFLSGREPLTGQPIYELDESRRNAKLGSPWRWVDMRLTRSFLKDRLSLFVEVRNLFNHKNAAIINPVTGRAYEYPYDVPLGWRDPKYPSPLVSGPPPDNPARYLPPRQVFLGLNWNL